MLIAYFHRARLTAAADITLPRQGLYLVQVRAVGVGTPGTFSLNYNGVASAHFPTPTNGTRGRARYKVNHKLEGTILPAASMAFNGGVSVVELLFSDQAPPQDYPPIERYRALRLARTDAGATTATISANFAGVATKPKSIVGNISASAGRATFPQVGNLTFAHEALITETMEEPTPVPDLPESTSLDLSVATDGAATIQFVVYY